MSDVTFEGLRVQLPDLRVWLDGREIFLSLTMTRLLLILLSDPCSLFTHGELVRRMHLTDHRALQQVAPKLRRRLGGKYIVNTPGAGYAFTEPPRPRGGSHE